MSENGRNESHTAVSKLKVGSVNGVMKSMSLTGLGKGGIRDLMQRFATIRSPSIRNAQILIVQPNPTSTTSRDTIMGNMTPPRLDPAAAIPTAMARFLKNHVMVAENAG